MISHDVVREVDQILDANVSALYKSQPLAQDWARIAKVNEEIGEAIAELITYTGQNPRKPQDDAGYRKMLLELADAAMTLIYAMQHFTKDAYATENYLTAAQNKHITRLRKVAGNA